MVEEARLALQRGDREVAATRAREGGRAAGHQAPCPVSWATPTWCWPASTTSWATRERAEWAYTAAIDAIQRQNGWTRELAKAYRWYGKFLKRMGRAEAALEAFELAADLAPSNQDALAPTPQSGVSSTLTTP